MNAVETWQALRAIPRNADDFPAWITGEITPDQGFSHAA